MIDDNAVIGPEYIIVGFFVWPDAPWHCNLVLIANNSVKVKGVIVNEDNNDD